MENTTKVGVSGKFAFNEPGNGEAGKVGFLLVHGLGGTPVELRFVAQGLNRAGFAVHCPLLTGHGDTDEVLNGTTWQDWERSVEAAIDEMKTHCEAIVIGGLSVGAVLALGLAARRPDDIKATILFSPTFWPNGWAIPKSFQLFRLIRHKWFANLFRLMECAPYGIKDERIRRFMLDSLQRDGRPMKDIFGRRGGTIWEFRVLSDRVRKCLGNIKQPALIFHPREDDQSDLSNTIMLQRRLAGLVDTVVLDDSYHMVTLDRQRTIVVEHSVAFGKKILSQLAPKTEQEATAISGATGE